MCAPRFFLFFVMLVFWNSTISLPAQTKPLSFQSSAQPSSPSSIEKNKKKTFSGLNKRRVLVKRRKALEKVYTPLYAYIVLEAESGRVLRSYNADGRTYPASLTKMLTAYLTFEALDKKNFDLETPLTVSERATRQIPTKLWLKKGQVIRAQDALVAMIVKSHNDATVALAEALGGSETHFAYKMNQKARQLGMYHTFFVNSSGVPDVRQTTTARDMALLARALYLHFPHYYAMFGQKTFSYGKASYTNSNKLLGTVQGVDGMKTGYIRLSGFNLAVSAKRQGVRIIAVVMGGKTAAWRNQQMTQLIESTFKMLQGRKEKIPGIPLEDSESLPVSGKQPSFLTSLGRDSLKPAVQEIPRAPSVSPPPPCVVLPSQKPNRIEIPEKNENYENGHEQDNHKDKEENRDPEPLNALPLTSKTVSVDPVRLPSLPWLKIRQLDAGQISESLSPEMSQEPTQKNPKKFQWSIQWSVDQDTPLIHNRILQLLKGFKLPQHSFAQENEKTSKILYQGCLRHLTETQAHHVCALLKKQGIGCVVLPP